MQLSNRILQSLYSAVISMWTTANCLGPMPKCVLLVKKLAQDRCPTSTGAKTSSACCQSSNFYSALISWKQLWIVLVIYIEANHSEKSQVLG